MDSDQWKELVTPPFAFLQERYGMRILEVTEDTWATEITFGNDRVGVIVRFSVEFVRAEVELVRMVDGKVPAYPIFIHPDTRIDRSLLDNLLQIRSRADLEELGKLGGLKSEELQRSLTFQAKALAEHAADFLSGATSVFDDLDKLIKARVTADPQRVQLWFPEGTTQAEIDKAIEETEAVDGRVPIDVKFYRRPPPEKRR